MTKNNDKDKFIWNVDKMLINLDIATKILPNFLNKDQLDNFKKMKIQYNKDLIRSKMNKLRNK